MRGHSESQILSNITVIEFTFNALRLLLSLDKSILILVQIIEFIGAPLGAIKPRAFLPQSRLQTFHDLDLDLKAQPVMTVHTCL